jgi:pyruvate dehydrogenase E1 component alpha subunit
MPKLDPYRDSFQILKPDGTLTDPKLDPKFPKDELLGYYKLMVLVRVLDDRMITFQRQGRVGFYIGAKSEEASHVASVAALRDDDPVLPCYREPGAALMRGMTLRAFLDNMVGNRDDLAKGRQMPCHIAYAPGHYLSVSSPVGTQIPQAMGMGWASRIMDNCKRVPIVFFGDGATSQGDFHVAANFAGVFKIPVIFLCRNNQYAISTSFEKQTASDGIAIKSVAYGIEGIRVDGNDFFAVYHATKEAAKRARAGKGPTLIEAYMYRMGPHSSSDDPRAYRTDDEVKKWEKHDPILRLRKYLERKKWWSEKEEKALWEATDKEVLETFRAAEKVAAPDTADMFNEVYADMPWNLREQHEELSAYLSTVPGGRILHGGSH